MKAAAKTSARAVAFAAALVAIAASPGRSQTAWPSEGRPRPLPSRPASFPPYEIRTLPNGLQVVAVLHHEQPVVSMRMIVRAGGVLDPRGKAGVADLTASLLDQGTTTRTANQMNDEIDFIGGAMGAGAGPDLTFVNVVVMKDGFETGLGLLSDMARHPAFAAGEIERKRRQTLSALQVSFEDPEFIADAVFDRLVYGFHPYGLPQSGTPDTLASITRDDLVAFHERNFVPNNAILAIVGDVTADEAFDGVAKVFGDWQRRDVVHPALTAPPDPTRRVIVINKPDAVQTEVRAGHLGVRRGISDYMPLNLALRILGGEGANRLHQLLRTERGLTYGAKADMDTLLDGGDFEASTNTRSEATGEVLRLIVDEFWRLQRERVDERELANAKAYITGSFPLTIETPDEIATQVLDVLFYGLPVNDLQTYRERVNAVRPDDIERVSRYYLRPDRLSVVLVGNAAAFVPQLRGLGFQNFEVVNMADLDLMAVDFKKPGVARPGAPGRPAPAAGLADPASHPPVAYQPAAAQTSQREPRSVELGLVARGLTGQGLSTPGLSARAILEQVIAAKGGLERLRAVKSITAVTRATGHGPNAAQGTVETVTYLEYPNRVRVESTADQLQLLQVYDGTQAWVKDRRGTHPVSAAMMRDLEVTLRRDAIAALLAADEGRLRARRLLDARDGSGALRRILELSAPDLDPMILAIDSTTNLIVAETYISGAGRTLIEERFSDYRSVDGVQVAHSTSVRIHGEPVLERTVTSITLDGPLSPALFQRPAS